MKTNNALYYITLLLTVIGAINWGLVGLADINLVKTLFGHMPGIERIVYLLVGASGLIYGLLALKDHECHMKDHHHNKDTYREKL